MNLQTLPSRRLVAFAGFEAFADRTLTILARLGYQIEFAEDGDERGRPDLHLVDERRLLEVPEYAGEPSVPIVVLAGRQGATAADSRIVGAVKRPAGMHDLYRVLQQVFEDTPRTTPRIPTHLFAVCRRSGHEWNASVLSLSENGCLLRSPEPVPLGTQLQLAFELPRIGTVHLWAETAYQLVPDLGLVFSSTAPRIREAITGFVTEALLSGDSATVRPSG
jgi:hypothetical protein